MSLLMDLGHAPKKFVLLRMNLGALLTENCEALKLMVGGQPPYPPPWSFPDYVAN